MTLTRYIWPMRPIFFILCIATGLSSLAQDFSLHINKAITPILEMDVVCCAFNDSDEFDFKNSIIEVEPGTYSFAITNNDTLNHTFSIDGMVDSDNEILPGETETFEVTFDDIRTYRYYSAVPQGEKLGASGQILVGYSNYQRQYWNLFDLDSALTYQINLGEATNSGPDYQPELFFINGRHYPETLEDPDAYVEAQVGDTVIISIINSGHMDHVLHFHGFHAEILDADILGSRVGWIKDSFPLKKEETMTIMLVPDQEGIYPVHDHNLIAVTNAGFYPGGMLTHLVISE